MGENLVFIVTKAKHNNHSVDPIIQVLQVHPNSFDQELTRNQSIDDASIYQKYLS